MDMDSIFKLVGDNSGVVAILFTMIGYIIVSSQMKLVEDIHKIRRDYQLRTFGTIDVVIKHIINTTYARVSEKVRQVTLTCSNVDCKFVGNELLQQKQLFYFILKDLFNIDVRNIIKLAILENGFHDKVDTALSAYITLKATSIWEDAIKQLGLSTEVLCPEINKIIGGNFELHEAIEQYKIVVDSSISNTNDMNKEIKKLKDDNNPIANILKIKSLLGLK